MDQPVSRRVDCYKEKPGSDIIKQGCLKKLKTLKKKYFVLRATSSSGPARLDYYDSEKKFKSSHAPKKSILLYQCFNINMRTDVKHRFIIVLYLLSSNYFSIVVDSETEQNDWFNKLLDYQNEYLPEGEQPRIHYEHVWQGAIKQKSATSHLKITGPYRMCLLEKDLVLVHLDSVEPAYTFQLSSIRTCGHSSDYFFVEVGRTSVTGVGELWMQVDDAVTSENMHVTVLEAMQLSRTSSSDHFRRRSETTQLHVSQPDTAIRKRAASQSHPQKKSPRGNRASLSRPSSAIVMYACAAPIIVDAPDLFGSSAGGAFDHMLFDTSRLRTDSIGSKGSHSSYKSEPFESYGSGATIMTPDGSLAVSCEPPFSKVEEQFCNDEEETTDSLPMMPRSTTPSPTRSHGKMGVLSVDGDYLVMTPGNRSKTSSPLLERPGSSCSDSHASHQCEGYMDMKPTSTNSSPGNSTSYMSMTPPKSTFSSNTGLYMNVTKTSRYIDMNPGQRTPTEPGTSYIVMDGGRARTTAPIAIRQEPAYFEMGPSSQPLPTVKEGGSGEAYLPMSPDRYSFLSSGLKPAKVVSYLSDDAMSGEFPKRAYSVGSRPKPAMKCYPAHDVLRRQPLDNSMSSSAPHLIVPKTRPQLDALYRNQQLDSSTGSLSTSVKSDTTDSFMEMEFYRPRTASDSFGCHPRTSNFGKQCVQSHRPRSLSHGQTSKLNLSKLAMEYPTESLESVRGSLSGLSSRRQSQESIGKVSNSSRNSSSDSLKRISEDYQNTKISEMPEYMNMRFDKHSVASSSIHSVISSKTDPPAYIDMKLGTSTSKSSSQCASPSSSVHSLGSSPVSAIHNFEKSSSIKVVKPSGNAALKQSFKPQGTAALVSEADLQVSVSDLQNFERSPLSSRKESENESYVPFHPRLDSAGKTQGPGHEFPANVQKSHPGLTYLHGCSEPCDSSIKSPEILSNANKLLRLKKDEPQKTKVEDEHKYGNIVNKREQDKFDSEKQNLAKGNVNDFRWENTGPTLDGIDFIPDNDLFSNKRFSNIPPVGINLQVCASQSPGHQVSKPNNSLNYLPGFVEGLPPVCNMNSSIRNESKENCLAKAAHHTMRPEHRAEREYYEIDLPHEQAQKSENLYNVIKVSSDYMLADPSSAANVEKLFEDKKLNENFSYMDFDPPTENSNVINEIDNTDKTPLRSPLKVTSFVMHSNVSVEHAKNTKTDLNLETCVDSKNKDNYCPETGGVKNANEENVQQSKSNVKSQVQEDSNEDEISKYDHSNSNVIDHEENKCHGGVNDNRSNDARNDSKFDFEKRGSQLNSEEGFSRRRHSLKDRRRMTEEWLVLSDNGSAVERTERKDKALISDHKALGKLLIKQTHFIRTDIEPDQDEGYVELDFSDRKKPEKIEKEVSNVRQIRSLNMAKVETEAFNTGCRVRMKGTGIYETDESTVDLNRKYHENITRNEELPSPETPKCYISDDSTIPTPETPISYIWDDSSFSGTSVSSREIGTPLKQPLAGRNSMPATVKGQGSGEGSRKSLLPTKKTSQCTKESVSRQTSVSSTASSSPRTSVEIQVINPRCRKTSGPASFSSTAKSENTGNTQILEPLISVQELHKQNSMPCMFIPLEKNISSIINEVHGRHSFTDLTTYEEMSPGVYLGSEHTGSHPQLWQNKELYYADLDLTGSSEHMEIKSPRITKIWHLSSLNDLSKTKVPYAEIDYLKTESIKNVPDKEVKFTL